MRAAEAVFPGCGDTNLAQSPGSQFLFCQYVMCPFDPRPAASRVQQRGKLWSLKGRGRAGAEPGFSGNANGKPLS